MNSSDSEDFESADEDLDLDNQPKHKTHCESTKIKENNEKAKFPKQSSGNSPEILNKLKQVNLEESVVVSKESESIDRFIPEDSNKRIPSDEKSESVKPSVKKLGTKISTPTTRTSFDECVAKVKNDEDELKTSLNYESDKSNKEPKKEEKKLGVKINNKGDEAENIVERNDTNKLIGSSEKCDKAITKEKSSAILVQENSKGIPSLDEMNWEASDGWEIEEEDGFEIPALLAKTGDGAIQGAQEQISELDQVEFRPPKEKESQGWGGWGVSSLLSTATTLSSHVSAGLSTVLETTVGAPDPETLAHSEQAPQGKYTKVEDETGAGFGGLGSIVSGVSFLGSSVINRGLDTLETIGKKTMEVLQEGDPGLKKKRAMLFQNQDKPILSQILREAKEKADNSDKEKEVKEAARKVHFESLFDDFQGMVHLEALEMLSTQCELKLQSLIQYQSGTELLDLQETLSQVRDLCELAEDEEDSEVLTPEQFNEKIVECVNGLNIKIKPTKILQVNSEILERLEGLTSESATVVNEKAILSLAELTAAVMECFHKSAELLLAKPLRNTTAEADSYVQLTNHLCARVSAVANDFTQLLTKNHPIANSSLITNIFLEASNSCSYIKNAFQLLIPILQAGTVKS